MELVDRYLHAVKRHLPAAQQDDIVRELGDDIMSEMSDREAELGRPLDQSEQETVLKRYGRPLLLAMRYRPQQHLIGPGLFPFYWPTLKTSLAIACAVYVVVMIGTSLAQDAPDRILPRFGGVAGVAIQTFGWITIAFAAIDFWHGKLNLRDNWSPRSLPPITTRPPRLNRAALIGELAGGTLFLAWWLAGSAYPFLLFGPGAALLTLTSEWHRVYLVATLPAVISILMLTAALTVPAWKILARLRPVVVNLMTVGMLSVMLNAGDLLAPARDAPNAVRMVRGLNDGIHLVLAILSVVTALMTVYEVIKLVRTQGARG